MGEVMGLVVDILLGLGLFALFSFSISGVCAFFLFDDKKRGFWAFGTLLFIMLTMVVLVMKVMGDGGLLFSYHWAVGGFMEYPVLSSIAGGPIIIFWLTAIPFYINK